MSERHHPLVQSWMLSFPKPSPRSSFAEILPQSGAFLVNNEPSDQHPQHDDDEQQQARIHTILLSCEEFLQPPASLNRSRSCAISGADSFPLKQEKWSCSIDSVRKYRACAADAVRVVSSLQRKGFSRDGVPYPAGWGKSHQDRLFSLTIWEEKIVRATAHVHGTLSGPDPGRGEQCRWG